MGRKTKLEATTNWRKEGAAAKWDFLMSRLKPSTNGKYGELTQRVEKLWNEVRAEDANATLGTDFFSFLLDRVYHQTKDANAGELYRSAILAAQKDQQRLLGPSGELWAESAEAKRISSGFRRKVLLKTAGDPIRGSFTADMVEAATAKLKQEGKPFQIWMMKVIFGATLRFHEVCNIKAKDFDIAKGTLFISNWKADNSNTLRNKPELGYRKRILDQNAKRILTELKLACPREEDYFFPLPKFSVTELGEWITSFVREQGWFPELKFEGVHTLRHGGLRHLRESFPEEEIADSQGISVKQLRHYITSNEDRVQKVRDGRKTVDEATRAGPFRPARTHTTTTVSRKTDRKRTRVKPTPLHPEETQETVEPPDSRHSEDTTDSEWETQRRIAARRRRREEAA